MTSLLGVISLSLISQSAISAPLVSDNTISWPADGWYQVQRPVAQNGNGIDWNLCNSNTHGSSCTVPAGSYRVLEQGGKPWRILNTWDLEVGLRQRVGYQRIYFEDFEDSFPANLTNDAFDGTPEGGTAIPPFLRIEHQTGERAAVMTKPGACSQSGGKLKLDVIKVGNELRACYLVSSEKFGPGNDSTLKVQIRANGSQVKAGGVWMAGWMYAYGSNNGVNFAEDQNPATGMEIDIFEYVQTNATAYNTALHDGAKSAAMKAATEGWHYERGVNSLWDNADSEGYFVFTIEWNKNCVAFFLGDEKVKAYNNATNVISPAENHQIRLTMEAQSEDQYIWGGNPFGSVVNNVVNTSSYGLVDWVKVFRKNSIDPNLCTM